MSETRVESRTGAVTVVSRWACDSAFAASPQSGLAWFCFLFPLIEPDWQISRIRLSEKTHAFAHGDRKSTRLNSSHTVISYAVFCLKKKKDENKHVASFAPRPARVRNMLDVGALGDATTDITTARPRGQIVCVGLDRHRVSLTHVRS